MTHARKTHTNNNEAIINEKNELNAKLLLLQTELLNYNAIKSELLIINNNYSELTNKYNNLLINNNELMRKHTELHTNYELIETIKYSLNNQNEILNSDLLLLQTDYSQKLIELNNLYNIINLYKNEKENIIKNNELLINQTLNSQLLLLQTDFSLKETKLNEIITLKTNENTELQMKLQDLLLIQRKLEINYKNEKNKLVLILNNTINSLNNNNNNIIDKSLISNLIINYFQNLKLNDKKKTKDILIIIANILNFTNEMKVIVGLLPASHNFITSLIEAVTVKAVEKADVASEVSYLTD